MSKKRGPGRPKKSAADRADVRLACKVTTAYAARVATAAENEKARMSEIVRTMIDEGLVRRGL